MDRMAEQIKGLLTESLAELPKQKLALVDGQSDIDLNVEEVLTFLLVRERVFTEVVMRLAEELDRKEKEQDASG